MEGGFEGQGCHLPPRPWACSFDSQAAAELSCLVIHRAALCSIVAFGGSVIFRVLLLNLHRVTVTRHHIQPVVFEVNMQPRGSMYHKKP